MSTHKIECVPVKLEKHEAADSLSIVRVFGGYTVCVRTEDWLGRDRGIYVEPDYVVPLSRPEFAFLQKPGETKETSRIKVKKLRGVVSHGLLIPAPPCAEISQDFMESLGITRYEPPVPLSMGGEVAKGPPLNSPKYDVESWRKYGQLFKEGEAVVITEKIHGANGRYVFYDETLYCGSRTEWKKESESNLWWKCLRQNEWIGKWCQANPGWILYGEVFGQVQDLKYGAKQNQFFFAAFDILTPDGWMPWHDFMENITVCSGYLAPSLYWGPYSNQIVEDTAKGRSMAAIELGSVISQIREGCVIKPIVDRITPEIGRLALKCINDAYLERA